MIACKGRVKLLCLLVTAVRVFFFKDFDVLEQCSVFKKCNIIHHSASNDKILSFHFQIPNLTRLQFFQGDNAS